MDLNLIYVGIVLIVAGILLIIFWPRDDSLHRNLSSGFVKIIVAGLVIVVIICCFFAGKEIVRNGVGKLYTDYAEVVQKTADDEGDMLVIIVNLGNIQINGKDYSLEEVAEVISNGINEGKNIRVVDDYALAATYNGLMDLISGLGIDRTSIEEVKTP